jgi:hypothetical protein
MSLSNNSNNGGSTCVVELQNVSGYLQNSTNLSSHPRSIHSLSIQEDRKSKSNDDPNESLPSPTTAVERLQNWNRPRANLFRSFAAFWAFTVMGMNDAAYGVCAMTLRWKEFANLSSRH